MLLKIVFPREGYPKMLASSDNEQFVNARAALITKLTERYDLEEGDLVIGTQELRDPPSPLSIIHNWNQDGQLIPLSNCESSPIFVYSNNARFGPQENDDIICLIHNWIAQNKILVASNMNITKKISIILIPSLFITA